MANSYSRDENGVIRMTEEEAKEVQNVQCRSRDFWTYDLSANKEVLQAALDVLHNCTPGNKFTVEYKDCQNSCRLVIFCHPCNTELSSLDPFISHAAGKNHKKCVVQLTNKQQTERSLKQSFELKPFNAPKKIFERGSLEDNLDTCRPRVLGMQFVYKEKLEEGGSYYYSCQLCDLRHASDEKIYQHLTGKSHNKKYLAVKFKRRVESPDEYEKACKEIEEREGKINHTIIDFTRQNELIKKASRRPSPDMLPPTASPPSSPEPAPRARSATATPPTPPPPLVASANTQTDADELQAPLLEELVLIKANGGDKLIAADDEALQQLMVTMQALNVKLHEYYSRSPQTIGMTKYTRKYHEYMASTLQLLAASPKHN